MKLTLFYLNEYKYRKMAGKIVIMQFKCLLNTKYSKLVDIMLYEISINIINI